GDALADDGDPRRVLLAPCDLDVARRLESALSDGVHHRIAGFEVLAGGHRDLRAEVPGESFCFLGDLDRTHVAWRRVDEIAEPVDRFGLAAGVFLIDGLWQDEAARLLLRR